MNNYLFWGFLSSGFFLSAIPAISHQLRKIHKRKAEIHRGNLDQSATHSISLNQAVSSYFGVFSFFVFGLVQSSPDPFLTYPRAIVGALLYWLIWELYLDRRSHSTKIAVAVTTTSLFIPACVMLTGQRAAGEIHTLSHALVCLATIVMAQGALAQYRLLKQNQTRGAVSLPMHLVLYGKDFTGLMFGITIGATAWSIIAMHLTNLIMRAPIIFTYLRTKN